MAMMHFVGASPRREGKELVAQADPKEGDLGFKDRPDQCDGIVEHGRVARPVTQHHPVVAPINKVCGVSGGWNHIHGTSGSGEQVFNGGFGPKVNQGYPIGVGGDWPGRTAVGIVYACRDGGIGNV